MPSEQDECALMASKLSASELANWMERMLGELRLDECLYDLADIRVFEACIAALRPAPADAQEFVELAVEALQQVAREYERDADTVPADHPAGRDARRVAQRHRDAIAYIERQSALPPDVGGLLEKLALILDEDAPNKHVWDTYEDMHGWLTSKVLPTLRECRAALTDPNYVRVPRELVEEWVGALKWANEEWDQERETAEDTLIAILVTVSEVHDGLRAALGEGESQ